MEKSSISIRPMKPDDWPAVAKIYDEGIETGHATFEQSVPDWKEWDVAHLPECRLVAVMNGKVAGWAALSKVSERCVYAGVAEVSVYIGKDYRGRKLGSLLLKKLITESENQNIWTLQSGIFPENEASLKIHFNLGFRKIGFREKVGKMNGIWRDTILLERRSRIAGI